MNGLGNRKARLAPAKGWSKRAVDGWGKSHRPQRPIAETRAYQLKFGGTVTIKAAAAIATP